MMNDDDDVCSVYNCLYFFAGYDIKMEMHLPTFDWIYEEIRTLF